MWFPSEFLIKTVPAMIKVVGRDTDSISWQRDYTKSMDKDFAMYVFNYIIYITFIYYYYYIIVLRHYPVIYF